MWSLHKAVWQKRKAAYLDDMDGGATSLVQIQSVLHNEPCVTPPVTHTLLQQFTCAPIVWQAPWGRKRTIVEQCRHSIFCDHCTAKLTAVRNGLPTFFPPHRPNIFKWDHEIHSHKTEIMTSAWKPHIIFQLAAITANVQPIIKVLQRRNTLLIRNCRKFNSTKLY